MNSKTEAEETQPALKEEEKSESAATGSFAAMLGINQSPTENASEPNDQQESENMHNTETDQQA